MEQHLKPILRSIRALAIYLSLLASASLCYGAGSWNGVACTAWNGVVASAWNGTAITFGSSTTLLSESFEGAGTPSGWTKVESGGTVTFDDTTHPSNGTDNLKCSRTSNTTAAYAGWTSATYELWTTFTFYTDSIASNNDIFIFTQTINGTNNGMVYLTSGGKLRLYADSGGSHNAEIADTFAINTLYYVRCWLNQNTGAYTIEANTSGTFDNAGTDFAYGTNGTTGGVGNKGIYCKTQINSSNMYFDNIVVTTVDPASLPPILVLNEGFEEVDSGGAAGSTTDGYDSSKANTETGTINNDYATSPAPLIGSYSWEADGSGGDDYVKWGDGWYGGAATYNELYVRFKFSFGTAPPTAGGSWLLQLTTTGNTNQGIFGINTDRTLRVYNGTTNGNGTTAMSTGTSYYGWLHWKNDGTAEAAWDTTSTRPTSGGQYKSVSGGSGTSSVGRMWLESAYNSHCGVLIVDGIQVSPFGWPTQGY